ncbi:MAG: 30S ribosomal protein S6--L-glutamate ligase [Coleofasciculus sp. S288]|nr:30S ribosomal protein S6--L-glutamate ligase [Coleofasciculus sp. S288]
MKIAILSRNKTLYSTRRLVEAGEQRGHSVEVVDYLRCCMSIASHKPKIIYSGKQLELFDAIIPRIGASHTEYGTAVVRQFETMGVYCMSGSVAIAKSRNKLRCLQILARKGIGLPVTSFAHSPKDIDSVIEAVGGPPLVIKVLEGTQGIGVILAESHQAARSTIEAFRGTNVPILVQEYIREAEGADIRCFVIGDKVMAAMKRQGAPGEFRSNIHQGGQGSLIKLTPEERSTAVRAAKAVGLKVAGVDLLRSNHGSCVMEVNSSPGLEAIEGVTGIDIASKIVEYIEKSQGLKTDSNTNKSGELIAVAV